MGSRKNFDKEFKLRVVREMLAGKSTVQAAREHGLKYDLARRWLREYRKNPRHAFSGQGVPSTAEARVAELERLIGRLYEENVFLMEVEA